MTEILDDHVHLQRDNLYLRAVEQFKAAGGTRLLLAHMPYHDIPVVKSFDFSEGFRRTADMAKEVQEKTGIWCRAVVGPYPVELMKLAEKTSLEEAKELMLEGMDDAAELVEEGRALALGEIGRPHFPVDRDIIDASNEILLYGMRLARGLDCAVVLHTESGTPDVMRELAEMADNAGLPRERVVKHYSGPATTPELNHGLSVSVLASAPNVEAALRQGGPFMMETDFLDDPRRPGAVLNITTVPKRTKEMLAKVLMSGDAARMIHEEAPRRAYGPMYDE